MFKKIMAPVDLRHPEDIAPALEIADELARSHGATLVYVGVASSAPNALGHNPHEFADKLKAFGDERAAKSGLTVETMPMITHDPAVDMNDNLLDAIKKTGCDLVVMQTHRPGWFDHWFTSHGGYIAAHAPVSVFLVR
ncbi:MAG: universal stress protein [Pseudomonadota bacterium]